MSISILKGIHRRTLGLSKDNQTVSRNGFVAGGDDKPVIVGPSPDTVAVFDDFLGDLLADEWNVADGDTGGNASISIVAGTGGIARINMGVSPNVDTGAGMALNGGLLQWKGNQGSGPDESKNGLRFGARLKLSNYNDTGRRLAVFAGFTDSVGAEVPVWDDTGAALNTPATNAIGFLFGSRADTGWSAVSVNGGTVRSPVVVDTGYTANQYVNLELEVHHSHSDTGGTATFYVDGKPKATISSPIVMSAGLTPVIHALAEDTGGGMLVDIDWMNVSGPRDTGI